MRKGSGAVRGGEVWRRLFRSFARREEQTHTPGEGNCEWGGPSLLRRAGAASGLCAHARWPGAGAFFEPRDCVGRDYDAVPFGPRRRGESARVLTSDIDEAGPQSLLAVVADFPE